MEIYDISQFVSQKATIWPGDPVFRHRRVQQIRDGCAANVSAVDMCVHTGTHLDAPLHLDDSGNDVASLPLRHFIGAARVVAVKGAKSIGAADLEPLDWSGVERVLFKTGGEGHSGYSFTRNYVYLEKDAARFLADRSVLLVGTNAPSVDPFDSPDLPCHRLLLADGVAILENACLDNVPPGDYELICLPLKLAGSDGSPVRAILRR